MEVMFHQVDPADFSTRFPMRDAASKQADAITRETGYEHVVRWDRERHGYAVEKVPFAKPETPWDDEDNRPAARRPDWDRFPTRFVPLDDILIAVAGLAGFQWIGSHEYPSDPPAFVRDLQAALDLQYGRGHFWASRHGSRISVQCRYPVLRPDAHDGRQAA